MKGNRAHNLEKKKVTNWPSKLCSWTDEPWSWKPWKCHGHGDMWRTSCESGSAAVWCPANNFERKAEWQGETRYQARPCRIS